jgi:hypothetical protein
MLKAAITWSSKLGSLTVAGRPSEFEVQHPLDIAYGTISMRAEAHNGTEYVTEIAVTGYEVWTDFYPSYACFSCPDLINMGINLQHLSPLLKDLPKLRSFRC